MFANLFNKGNTISAKEAYEIMTQEKDIIVLDVRTVQEFKTGAIQGAKLIPVDQLSVRAAVDLPNKNQKILVYCQSGGRAGQAVSILNKLGYTNAVSFGGIMSWPYSITTEK